jgi:hypothetical protein
LTPFVPLAFLNSFTNFLSEKILNKSFIQYVCFWRADARQDPQAGPGPPWGRYEKANMFGTPDEEMSFSQSCWQRNKAFSICGSIRTLGRHCLALKIGSRVRAIISENLQFPQTTPVTEVDGLLLRLKSLLDELLKLMRDLSKCPTGCGPQFQRVHVHGAPRVVQGKEDCKHLALHLLFKDTPQYGTSWQGATEQGSSEKAMPQAPFQPRR